MTNGEPRPIGTFAVSAGVAEVAALRAATGCGGDVDSVPLIFPMRWLAQPEARAALLTMVPEPDLIPVHESQSFAYQRPLAAGETCTLDLVGRRETSPDRLIIDGVVADKAGATVVTVETILRLFSTRAEAA